MGTPLVISGLGLISPLGESPWATFRALTEGRSLADRLARCDAEIDPVSLVRGVGGVPASRRGPHDPTITLGGRVAEQALQDAGLTEVAARADVPMVLATSKGAVTSMLLPDASHEVLTLGPHGFVGHHLARRLAIAHWTAPVAACASSLAAVTTASRMIHRGDAEHVLVVAAEASLLPLFIMSYKRLGVLPKLNRTEYRCRPLDTQRAGFTLNEIAAAIVVSHPDSALVRARRDRSRVHLLGVRMANEAHDMIRSAPRAAALQRLASWAFDVAPIDVLHPHATGTVENDAHEMDAHADAMGARAEDVFAYAVKGAVGHGLGASGLVSLVIASMCGRCQRVPPMPWLESPVETPFRVARDGVALSARQHHAIFAAGFGGHVGSAVISVDRT